MKYYRDPANGEVFAYESDGSQDDLISEHLIALSAEEVSAHLNPAKEPLTRDQVSALRKVAYADPLAGSDPLYIEYQRESALGSSETAINLARQKWLDRASEIAEQYPCLSSIKQLP